MHYFCSHRYRVITLIPALRGRQVKKLGCIPLSAMVFFIVPATLFAANVTGTWKGPMQSGGDAVFELQADKGAITGNMLGRDGKPYPVNANWTTTMFL
jgi:hypothetical protein